MIARAYRWELRKLAAQKRAYVGLGAVLVAPLVLVAALQVQPPSPADTGLTFFVRSADASGFGVPLVLLLFASLWLFPLLAALVAGDIVACEDHNRTLKTILTRSAGRGTIFTAKVAAAFTYVVTALVMLTATGTLVGGLRSGLGPLPTFTTVVSAREAALLVVASVAVYALPVLALTAIGVLLSTVARNSAAAVVGTLMVALGMQLTQIIPGLDRPGVQGWLLTPQLYAWITLFRRPLDRAPLEHAAWLSLLYGVVALVIGWVHFVRRDVTG